MMSQFRRIVLIVLALLLLTLPTLAQSDSAQVRFVHAIPGASPIDIDIDGMLSVGGLAFGTVSNYVQVTAGTHHIAVMQSGSTTPLWEQDINPAANSASTLVASTATQPTFTVYQDDLNSLPLGKTRLTAIHAMADGPGVDILLADGRPVIPGLQYNMPYGTLDLPAMSYSLAVVPAGQPLSAALIAAQSFNLNSGTFYIALVYGTKDAPKALLISAPTNPEVAGGLVRLVHAIPGGSPADVYLNNTLVAPALAFGSATDFIALPTGSYNVELRAPGASTDLATGSLNVAADGRQTALITGSAEAPTVQTFDDDASAVSANTGVLSLMNATSGSTLAASTADGTSLLSSVAAGEAQSAPLQPGNQAVNVTVTANGAANNQTLNLPNGVYGGVYYSAVAVDGSSGAQVIQLPAVSLAQGSASAPGDQAVVATATPTPTSQPTAVAELPTATQAAPAAQPTQGSNGVQIQPQPSAYPTTTGPTGRVLVDPGVNLQLREYPSSTAFSLGLAPSGAILNVNGRQGQAVPPADTTATPVTPPATAYVDPVTLLQQGQDLDPASTWLNVTYATPDGGTITAWVNAVYVGVRDAQGRSMQLRDLPTVPSNRAGSAQNTSLQPPAPTAVITFAIATNVSPGVRVHIRRTPDVAGESLALVPAGTQMQLLGVNAAQDWVFVQYSDSQSTVTGWVSVEFVTLQRANQSVDFARLQLLNVLNTTNDTQRGTVVTTGAGPTAIATELVNQVAGTVTGLNSDANLHLRRTPSDQGESLALLPNGTTVVVTGRTEDGTWLQVNYQNQIGWVSSQYVTLSFNGKSYDATTLSVISTATPTPTSTSQG